MLAPPALASHASTHFQIHNDGLVGGAGKATSSGRSMFGVVRERVFGYTASTNYTIQTGRMIVESADFDRDKLPDYYEDVAGLDLTNAADGNADADGDALARGEEFHIGTDPSSEDKDGDALDDGHEIATGPNPIGPDTDGDGMQDNLDDYPVIVSNVCVGDNASFDAVVSDD